jgi:hypothetical protein
VVLADKGIVVCDDYRTEHAPGVAAAAWEAVLSGGLNVICLTRQKLYGTWSDASDVQAELVDWLADRDDLWHEVQLIADRSVVRVKSVARPDKQDAERLRHRLAVAERRRRSAKEQLAAVRRSRSYRIGRLITAPIRVGRRLWARAQK